MKAISVVTFTQLRTQARHLALQILDAQIQLGDEQIARIRPGNMHAGGIDGPGGTGGFCSTGIRIAALGFDRIGFDRLKALGTGEIRHPPRSIFVRRRVSVAHVATVFDCPLPRMRSASARQREKHRSMRLYPTSSGLNPASRNMRTGLSPIR